MSNSSWSLQTPRMSGKSSARQDEDFLRSLMEPTAKYNHLVQDSVASVAAAAQRHQRANRTTLGHWLAGDTDGYLPDLWGRAGLLEDGPKPKQAHEHRIVTSGLGETVTLACDCGWRENAPRDKAEAVASAHYTSPDGVRSVLEPNLRHQVTITDVPTRTGVTYRTSCELCTNSMRFHSYSDAVQWAKDHASHGAGHVG